MKIFIVEDDPVYVQILVHKLSMNPEYVIETFSKGKELLDNLHRRPNVISLDYGLPDLNGQELLSKIKARANGIPVIILSSQENISIAIEMLRNGAYDYIVKDAEAPDRLWNIIKNIKEKENLKKEIEELRLEVQVKFDPGKAFKGESPIIQKTLELIKKCAQTDINVSISGETGTGKEEAAKIIHFNSSRKNDSFVAVNMAAIPKELLESELFGHEKGAFTGAINRRIGKFEEAKSGTIFLDEIGELSLNLQAKLLRVLQENEITRIGGNNKIKINARLITATHKNLREEVNKGNFRKDLFFRIVGMPIHIPPLRERGNDIILLAHHFLDQLTNKNKGEKKILSSGAQKKLLHYHYPGNVRELKSVIELAAIMCDGNIIHENDITFNTIDETDDLLIKEDTLKGYTRRIIAHFLKKYDNNVVLVANKLDIGKSTIYQMIKNKELELHN